MNFKTIVGILILVAFSSCSQQTSKGKEQCNKDQNLNLTKRVDLKIENGTNQGIRANSKLGIKSPVIYTTSIITNDGAKPFHLQMTLSWEYDFPAFCDDSTYKVFLFPEELTPDSLTLTNTKVSGEDDFIKYPLKISYSLNKTLNPGEFCIITMGTSYSGSSNCEVVPRALFTYNHSDSYKKCDVMINPDVTAEPQLEIGIKLEFYKQRKFMSPEDHCTVIPCGRISYLEH